MIKEIKINNSTKKVVMKKEDRFLGVKGENKYETLKFTFEDNFLNGEGILEVQKPNSQKEYIILEKEEDCYLLEVKNSLLNFEGEIIMQLVVRMTDNIVFKSVEFSMQVLKAIEATTEIPDEYETWDSTLAAKILEIDSKLEDMTDLEQDLEDKRDSGYFKGDKGDTGEAGQDGLNGTDGFSPTVQTQTVENGVQVTITDANRSHTFTVLNGKDGEIDEEAISQAVTEYLNEHSIVVPTKTSDLTNDSDFVADANYVHTDNNYTTQEKQKLAGLSNYDDTEVKQSITSLNNNKANRSELPNVTSFITRTVNDLANYYLKNETYTKEEVNNLIGQIVTVSIQVVQELPQNGQTNIIYFVPKTGTAGDVYNEYIYVNNSYELIGSTQVDLSGYATRSWVTGQIANFLTQAQIEALINNVEPIIINNDIFDLNEESSSQEIIEVFGGIDNLNSIIEVAKTTTRNVIVKSKRESDFEDDFYLYPAYVYLGETESEIFLEICSLIYAGQQTLYIERDSAGLWQVSDRATEYFALEKDILTKNNTTPFTPLGNYEPSTKKYVDDSIASVVGDIETLLQEV